MAIRNALAVAGLLVVGFVTCATAPVAAQVEPAAEGPLPSATPRDAVVLPTFVLGGRRFFDLVAWLQGPNQVTGAWQAGDVVDIGRHLCLAGVASAPSPWRDLVGSPLPAYAADDGRSCTATIGALYLVQHEDSSCHQLPEDVSAGRIWGISQTSRPLRFNAPRQDDVLLVAEVISEAGCEPIVITNRPSPVFFTPAPPLPSSQQREIDETFSGLLAEEELNGSPTYEVYHTPEGRVLVLASIQDEIPHDDGCGSDYVSLRALFEVGQTAPHTIVAQSSEVTGDPVAVFDSNGDGIAEMIVGESQFDRGMDGQQDLVRYLDFADPSQGYQFSFSYYIGCD